MMMATRGVGRARCSSTLAAKGVAERMLFRSLVGILREQSSRLDYATVWPARPGLQGFAAAGRLVDLDKDMLPVLLEWEALLQQSEVRESTAQFLRSFFGGSSDAAWARAEGEYPVLSTRLRRGADRLDYGFAALRQASRHAELLEKLHPLNPGYPVRKMRPANLLFACGDVCEHRFFGRCVVVGWDEVCPQGETWVRANRIRENLVFGTEQPFYQVLLERDEIPRCCSQENLALCREDTGVFRHPHAPFYFRPRSFVPSAALAFVYPEDEAAASAERNYRTLEDTHDGP